MLLRRVLSAAVGIPVIVALILIGGVPYTVAVAIILALGVLEFYAATDPETSATSAAYPRLRRAAPTLFGQRMPAFAGCGGVVLLVAAAYGGLDELTGALAGLIAGVFLILILRQDAQTGLSDWLWIVGGLAYVGFLGAHLLLLRDLDDGREWVFVAVFSTFVADTAAYFVGRALGRRQIAPAVSPGKTVEGGIAGLVAGFGAVFIIVWVVGLDVDELKLLPLALLLPAVAVVGDLGESLIKRGAGVKDTSDLVPGHGGFLDRLDSVLFTTPLVYYFVIWVVL
ncbi:MAG: phosphatidate cytidylyltransferase [Chloroflexi bacterium]|nr:MAG: phosphatidate cytidylyltransferase [Chloroflexota bacterium]TMG04076.1 MAG: phosphatidate cytidylyltransferase [Chloroflexota bacterium]